jgi:multidrug efflux pump subunit AcrA (membrane-fusion protein)
MADMAEEGPRFRRDLVATPIELDGIVYVEANDPHAGNSFRFYEIEHAIALALDGRALGAVLATVQTETGLDLTLPQLEEFVQRLHELGFLEGQGPSNGAPVAEEAEDEEDATDTEEDAAAELATDVKTRFGHERVREDKATAEVPVIGEEEPAGSPDPNAPLVFSGELSMEADEITASKRMAYHQGAAVAAPGADTAADVGGHALGGASGEAGPEAGDHPEAGGHPGAGAEHGGHADAGGEDDDHTVAGADARQQPKPGASEERDAQENAVTKELQAFRHPGSGPADRPHPSAPLTEETAMPPVLDLRASEPSPVSEPLPVVAPPALAPAAGTLHTSEERRAESAAPPRAPAPPAGGPPAALEATLADGQGPGPASPPPSPHWLEPTIPALSPRLSPSAYAGLGLATAVVVGFVVYRLSTSPALAVLTVRTVVPTVGSVYRWFEAEGTVKHAGERTLAFSAGGKVAQVMAPGTAFHPGDVIAELEGARRFKSEVQHNRERLTHYEQLLEKTSADANRPEMRQAEIKVTEKKRLIAESLAALASQAVLATTSGEVAETLVTAGEVVKPGAPAVRTKGTEWRGELEMPREDADRLRHLGFCRAEIAGKPLDCSLSAEAGDETHVWIDLPADPAVKAGERVRVARARHDGVFVLPASALAPTRGSDRRVFVVKDGRAESYAVVLADQTPSEIVVTQGLEPGSAVVIDVPPSLRPRATVIATPAR